MTYFDKSQRIKCEILSTPQILNSTRNAFDEKIESISSGGTIELYSVGELPSGIHVALRVFRTDIQEGKNRLETQIRHMEHYCQNAEQLDSEGEPVPKFCIGTIRERKAGILTEDLSKGGTQEVEHNPDHNYALVGTEKRKVFIDIDGLFRFIPNLKLKYFLRDTVIQL